MNEADQEWLSDVAERWPVVSNEKLAEGTVVSVRRDVVRMPDGRAAAGNSPTRTA